MNRADFDAILEICLERIANGETPQACLADYPDDAEALRPLLTTAHRLHTLPRHQPRDSADATTRHRLLETWAETRQPSSQNDVASKPPRLPKRKEFHLMRAFLRFFQSWLPRLAVAGFIVVIVIFAVQLVPAMFEKGTETEAPIANTTAESSPVASVDRTPLPTPTAIPTKGAAESAETGEESAVETSSLATPEEVTIYRAQVVQTPQTAEEALAWATEFGLPDPQVFTDPRDMAQSLHVVSSDGRELVFDNKGYDGNIYYYNQDADPSGKRPSFTEASEIALAFLEAHGLLPAAYRTVQSTESQPSQPGDVFIVPLIDNIPLPDETILVQVAASGEVSYAHLTTGIAALEPVDTFSVKSQEVAFAEMLDGGAYRHFQHTQPAVSATPIRYYEVPLPEHSPGEEVTVYSQNVALLVATAGNTLRATLHSYTGARYDLTGSRVAELGNNIGLHTQIRVQGRITAQESPSRWQLEIIDWQPVDPQEAVKCQAGSLAWMGKDGQLQTDTGEQYTIPQAPAELAEGERIEVCWHAAENSVVQWHMISQPPVSEHRSGGGGGGGSGPLPAIPLPEESSGPAPTSGSGEGGGGGGSSSTGPSSPYQLGEQVELTGIIFGHVVTGEQDEREYFVWLRPDTAETDAAFPIYPLVAAPELLAEMGEHNQLHIGITGQMVPAPENQSGPGNQAIAVERYERLYPEEKIENFLGSTGMENIDRQELVIFTDHLTGERYVLQDATPESEGETAGYVQFLLTAVVDPVATVAGLPVLRPLGRGYDPQMATATDLSDFPVTQRGLPEIKAAEIAGPRGVDLREKNLVLDAAEVIYIYDQQQETAGGLTYLLRPAWRFQAHNESGTTTYTYYVQAIPEEQLAK